MYQMITVAKGFNGLSIKWTSQSDELIKTKVMTEELSKKYLTGQHNRFKLPAHLISVEKILTCF